MVAHPPRRGRVDEPGAGGVVEGERHAERDRLAMQQPVAEPGLGFEGMAERVAEIEERAFVAGLALVGGDRSAPSSRSSS